MLAGGSGDDLIYGGANDDQLYGGPGLDSLFGGIGNDILDGGGQADALTGGAGADRFVISFLPDAAAKITDFTLGEDKLDLNALLARSGYTGNDPVADGWLTIASDGSDGALVYFDPDGDGPRSGVAVADLEHVAPTSSNVANALAIYTPRASVATGDSAYVVPAQFTDVTLTGSGQTVTGNDAGDTIFSNGAANILVGGGGQDIFHIGGGGDRVTGGAGADIFAFASLPSVAAHITDFTPGEDIVDLSGLLSAIGYSGSNPAADGYLQVQADANGDAQVWARTDPSAGPQGWTLVATLDGVASSNVTIDDALIAAAGDPPTGYSPSGEYGGSVARIVGPGSLAEGDSGTTDFSFTVSRSGNLDGSSLVDYYLAYGGSADSSNFAGPTAGTVSFAAGQSSAVIHIAVAGDTTVEPDETFTIALSNARATSIDPNASSATATIVNDDNGSSGGSGSGGSGSSVSTSDATYTAPEGVTTITLTGTSPQTVHGNNDGDTVYSTDHGDTLFGGTGNDTFHLGRDGDIVTGGGGNDVFAFDQNPWSPYGHITDFNAGDSIDLSGALHRAGYSSGDSVGQGYIKVDDDGAGDARVWFDPAPSGGGAWWLVATLDGVLVSTVQVNGATVTTTSAGSGGSAVSTSDPDYTAPEGVTTITLTGTASQTVHANNDGDTIYSTDHGNTIHGGTGADTFVLGRDGDLVTGGGGDDAYVFNQNPWSPYGHITDFNAGDLIDLTGTLQKAGYSSGDPVAEGYLKIDQDAGANARIWFDPVPQDGHWWMVTTLDGVAAASLHVNAGLITA